MDPIKLTMDELKSLLGSVVETKISEHGLDKIDRRFGNFPSYLVGKSQDELNGMDKKAKVAEFIKAVFKKDFATLASFKAMNEGTGSAGGFIVPEEFAAEVNRIVEDFGLVPKLATKYPMGSDTLNVPRLGSSVSVSYPGETTAGTPSQPVLEQLQLLTKTLVGLTPMSNELLADANVDVVNLLTQLFAEAIAGEADKQGLAGTGSPFTGILAETGVEEVTMATDTFADITPDDCRDMITKIKPWSLQGATFVMHRSIWAIIQKQKSSTGGDYYTSAANPILTGVNQGFPTAMAGTLWGYPVYLSDKMPSITDDAADTAFVVFGNLKHIYWGVRNGGMAIAISEHATIGADNLFEQNMSGVRATIRHAVAVGLPGAFARLVTKA